MTPERDGWSEYSESLRRRARSPTDPTSPIASTPSAAGSAHLGRYVAGEEAETILAGHSTGQVDARWLTRAAAPASAAQRMSAATASRPRGSERTNAMWADGTASSEKPLDWASVPELPLSGREIQERGAPGGRRNRPLIRSSSAAESSRSLSTSGPASRVRFRKLRSVWFSVAPTKTEPRKRPKRLIGPMRTTAVAEPVGGCSGGVRTWAVRNSCSFRVSREREGHICAESRTEGWPGPVFAG